MPASTTEYDWPTTADEERWERYPGLAPTADEREQIHRIGLVARVSDADIDALAESLRLTPGAPILTRAELAAAVVAARLA